MTGDDAAQLEERAELLRALGHATRLQILGTLAGRELSVGDIEGETGIGQPGLSQQLAVLRKVDLVSTRRDGKQVIYSLEADRLREVARSLAGLAGIEQGERGESHAERLRRGGGAAVFAKVGQDRFSP
ncbi:hypothetical protein GCM10011371_19770 [Novosphingobium marinum]|uniref:DNA-binding transcriptional ArsR family regulator n=1 Tax=Novosphingobium marinum TaxID=1514948 RepID=A0A7Y9XZA9_9SPHN|nr:metalloregulator ArsR/SmtB family transcription factor [Novosphingobium marinum]NYH96090.1 DNA-binding transcriptional ArsR family regulator [Novosphingobium marinum]GGC32396.1 hypothetical protein GCM10011371_19770 [Novosphingobium marinum]